VTLPWGRSRPAIRREREGEEVSQWQLADRLVEIWIAVARPEAGV
jgi:hypothetical protein